MKKYFLFTLSLFFLISSASSINLKWCYKKKFIVSGYYSPLPNQKFYYKGNYYEEIKLNWKWKITASGKKVFNGIIAAPKKYKFWTKIYFPFLKGVWIVEDRWSDIVEAGKRNNKYDRIDIWMGYWEKWLIRALSFGKRTLIGYVCPTTKKIKVGFDFNYFPIYTKRFFEITLWAVNLKKWRKDNWVKTLQKYLTLLGFFNKKYQTGFFWPITKKALCKYQIFYNLKNKKNCWIFDLQTRIFMKKQLIKKWFFSNKWYQNYIIPAQLLQTQLKELSFNRGFLLNEKNYKIKILQKYLKLLWYYNWPLNWIYTSQTAEAVYKFQKDYKIIKPNTNIKVLGYFGPKTRKKFKEVVFNYLKNNLK